jgi:putative transposase
MRNVSGRLRHIIQSASMLLKLMVDAVCDLGLCLRSHPTLAAEVLFLRKQLALHAERQVKSRRAANATRIVMVGLSHCFDWRAALRIVKPETLTHWHRQGFRLFWKWKSKPGRPALPKNLPVLSRRMLLENQTWGQERIANELGIPLPSISLLAPLQGPQHQLLKGHRVGVELILGSLHHEYEIENQTA